MERRDAEGGMLTPSQVADRLGVTPRHVRRLCVEGFVSPVDGRHYRLQAYKLRRRVLIPAEAVEDFLAATCYGSLVPAAPPAAPESPARQARRAAAAKQAALQACGRGE